MNGFLNQKTHHTLHQALLWVQNSPPLFNHDASFLFLNHPLPHSVSPFTPSTQQLDTLSDLLKAKGNPLLGIFYETLWQFLLNQLPGCQLLAHNLQVQGLVSGQTQTLGEYDLIYRCQQQIIHRELAVKFYLGIPASGDQEQGTQWQQWVGPGLKDRLDRKMARLIHHQGKLSDTGEGQQTLAGIGIDRPVQKEVLIQGRLFYPLFSADNPTTPLMELKALFQPDAAPSPNQTAINSICPPPEYCNPGHLRGFWLTLSQFRLWSEAISEDCTYQLPGKWQWLNQQPDAGCLDHKTLLSQFRTLSQPIYVMVLNSNLIAPIHLFIVPDEWPGQAEAVPHR